MRSLAAFIILSLIAQGCETAVTQYPPGSGQIPGATTNPQQAKIDNDRRWAHAVESAQKAAFLGGIFGGPFGAPASMVMGVIGFTYGMFSADSKIAEEKAQAQVRYQMESDKDRALESAIEQEIERQRALENQIAGVTGQPVSTQPARLPPQVNQPAPAVSNPPPQSGNPAGAITVARASTPPRRRLFAMSKSAISTMTACPIFGFTTIRKSPARLSVRKKRPRTMAASMPGAIYKDGQLVRRDVDRAGSGRPDTIYYYENDKIVREERDETGQGRMTYRASYQNGRIEKVEKDSIGQGRPDLWIFYDISRDGEVVVKEERDLNGDGIADLWSFYDNGRLVRRDVNAPGLEILSKQDQVPLPAAEIRPPATPGS